MATIGFSNVHAAKVTEDPTTKNETYETPFRLTKGIQAELTITNAEGKLYADDAVAEVIKEFISGTLKLTGDDLTPTIKAKLLGQLVDDNNVVVSSGSDEAPYFAVGYEAKKPGGQYEYTWLLKVKFSVPNETLKTKDESITFNTPEIEGEVVTRNLDGAWKVNYTALPTDATAAAWFSAVYAPEITPA
jgi:phi13 family phage major tail protein